MFRLGDTDYPILMIWDSLPVVLLLVMAAAVVVAAALRIARSSFTPSQLILLFIAILFARLLWRARLPRRFPFPRGQGGVVVCNHRSSIDPVFVQVCVDRPTHWMVAREYCEHPAFRWFLRTCGVIPVNRGGIDTAAIKQAIRIAAAGGIVGMLPEGRINTSEQFMLPVRPGAVLVAIKARVPILPCYVEGSPYGNTSYSPLFMPAKVRLVFGEPIDLSEYYERLDQEGLAAELTLRIVREIARLAGREDFQPTLASRHWKPLDDEEVVP